MLTLHAFIAKGDDDDEGLCAQLVGQTWMPLIAGDEARLEQLRALAEGIAKASGKKIELVRFVRGQLVETYDGRKS